MKKYKFIGILMVMAGNGSLLSILLDEVNYNVESEPQTYFSSITALLLGFYLLRLSNRKSII